MDGGSVSSLGRSERSYARYTARGVTIENSRNDTLTHDCHGMQHPKDFYREYVGKRIRPDGRKLDEIRRSRVALGPIERADGSAAVRLGNTTVIAGIDLEVTTPAQDRPSEGDVAIDVQLLPICSPKISLRGGPPEEAFSVAEFLKRTVFSKKACIDMNELCIEKGTSCWLLRVHIICLDHDGNVLDAAYLALTAALYDLRVPPFEIDEDDGVVYFLKDTTKESSSLRSLRISISRTFGIFDDTHIIVDPTAEEEELVGTVVTIVVDEAQQLLSVYMPGGASIQESILRRCIELSCSFVSKSSADLRTAISRRELEDKGLRDVL